MASPRRAHIQYWQSWGIGPGLRTGQATAVAVSQCRRSRKAEISCQSSARTQSKGAVANGVLAEVHVMMCWWQAAAHDRLCIRRTVPQYSR